ncbi:MAG: ribonuclease H-like domain-containing protein [Candidatus Limivivens sp.]|nr:ribonuclease H-like domain-containing protein [Candidatus Limivivens sp.]
MITKTFTLFEIPASLPESLPDPGQICFLDIETSGYARKNARLCYAGCIIPEEKTWSVHQWIPEIREEEADLYRTLADFLKPWPLLAHFGGTSFDLPFLKKKWTSLGIASDLSQKESLDFYRILKPFQKLWNLEHMDQKTLENFLGLSRSPEDNDLTMLPRLIPLLAFRDLAEGKFRAVSARPLFTENTFQIQIELKLTSPLPAAVSHLYPHFYMKAEKDTAQLLVYGLCQTLKYFFKDYKNYYYLPMEDQAIHKSVAAYVEKENREPAKASTCYTKKSGCFLPQPAPLFSPSFRSDYHDTDSWFLYTEEFARDTDALRNYTAALLAEAFPSG